MGLVGGRKPGLSGDQPADASARGDGKQSEEDVHGVIIGRRLSRSAGEGWGPRSVGCGPTAPQIDTHQGCSSQNGLVCHGFISPDGELLLPIAAKVTKNACP